MRPLDPDHTPQAAAPDDGDLGFRYQVRKNGDVEVRHDGRLAATLRGSAAVAFVREAASAPAARLQQRMARLTGNYKRGNEGQAGRHARNGG